MSFKSERIKRRALKRHEDWRTADKQELFYQYVRSCLPGSFDKLMRLIGLRLYSPECLRSNLTRDLGFSINSIYGFSDQRIQTDTNDPFGWDWGLIFAAALHDELSLRLVNRTDWQADIRKASARINQLRAQIRCKHPR